MSIGLYIVLAPLYLKSVRKLQEKRFVFVKILAIIIPENGAKVSKIKCFQFAQQTLIIILSTVGAVELFVEFVKEYENMRIRFINWRDRECKIKCLCNHSYSINYLWYRDKEVCLKCSKCNKVKRIQLDDKTFETFCEVWKEKGKNR